MASRRYGFTKWPLADVASQNGFWQRWLHKMASGRHGFTKWPLADMASRNDLWQRWLHKMASGRYGFTKWSLADMASQNDLWQTWLHKMASGRGGFTKWPLADLVSQNGFWQRWLYKIASGRGGFTKWSLLPGGGQVSERNSASVFEVGDDNDTERELKRKQTVKLHNTDASHLTVSRHFTSCTTYSQQPHYFLITINSSTISTLF